MTLTHPIGLRQMLAAAEDEAQIRDLLVEGDGFTLASAKTKRAWKSTARRRLKQLAEALPPGLVSVPKGNRRKVIAFSDAPKPYDLEGGVI